MKIEPEQASEFKRVDATDVADAVGASAVVDAVAGDADVGTVRLPNVFCPRCGYDMSGAVAAWTDSCPVEGTCPECGLSFAWRDLYVESRRRERRLFEHAEVRLCRALIGTLLLTLTPSRLWHRVRMELTISVRRIVAMVLCGLLLMYAARTALALAHRTIEHFVYRTRVAWVMPEPWFHDPKEWVRSFWPKTLLGEAHFGMRRLESADVPSATWMMLLACVIAPLCFALLPETLRRCKVRREHLLRVTLYLLPTLVLTQSVPWLLLDGWSALAEHASWTARPGAGWDVSYYKWQSIIASWRLIPATVVGTLWIFWWWRCAAKHYLRLPHATGVAAAIVALSLLIATGTFVALGGGEDLLVDLAMVVKPLPPW